MTEQKWNIGDIVWEANYGTTKVQRPCPVCCGKLEVTLILGNDERVVLPCEYCGHGMSEPRGYLVDYERIAQAKPRTIAAIESTITSEGAEYEYRTAEGHRFHAEDIYATEAEAIVRAEQMAEKAKADEDTRAFYLKQNKNKTYAWNAGYHMDRVERAKKDIEYHTRKAQICQEKSKARQPA